ncbi:S9 family peptidase [Pseudomonas sp. O64]|uniref:S9 family peptidase n=1 Tax=unclassified Pseudomonas TaxID=196821 RepID=UPI0021D989F6|nr:S9 family peptidase [Pseudomonas sp. YeP6b]UXZ23798.1 S9 family peptidase [Pseudomonas sp. YeP6b]
MKKPVNLVDPALAAGVAFPAFAQAATNGSAVPNGSIAMSRDAAADSNSDIVVTAQNLHCFDQIALDPEGRLVASIEGDVAATGVQATHNAVVLRRLGEARLAPVRQVATCDHCTFSGVAVASNGAVTYLMRRPDGRTDVIVDTAGQQRTLASIDGNASTPRWSPSGSALGLLVTIAPRKETGPTQPGARTIGEQGANEDRQRLAIVDEATGAIRFASTPELFVFDFDWAPDGAGLVGIAVAGDGDNDWYHAELLAFCANTESAGRLVVAPQRQLMGARVSPDGTQVAFISGLMSDYNQGGGDIYTVPIAGGPARNVTAGADATFNAVQWQGRQLVAAGVRKNSVIVVKLDPADGRLKTLWSDATSAVSANGGHNRIVLSQDGKSIAGIYEGYDRAPELIAGGIPHPTVVSDANRAMAGIASGQSITWSSDGYDVQGWLVTPLASTQHKRRPLVVVVHGGPSDYGGPEFIWEGWRRGLIERGYALFFPNFRGSAGRGEAFRQANLLDLGGGDLRDILSGVDKVEKTISIDPDRIGITGFSYGGFMSMWAVTQTQRFKAAAAGASIANWVSYYGQNGIDKWLLPYFGGTPHDNRKAYEAASPLNFVNTVTTPTFIYVGERDIETPPVQSREFWKALRDKGVPTTLMIYADEGHRLRNPSNAADAARRIVDWFDHYMPCPDC